MFSLISLYVSFIGLPEIEQLPILNGTQIAFVFNTIFCLQPLNLLVLSRWTWLNFQYQKAGEAEVVSRARASHFKLLCVHLLRCLIFISQECKFAWVLKRHLEWRSLLQMSQIFTQPWQSWQLQLSLQREEVVSACVDEKVMPIRSGSSRSEGKANAFWGQDAIVLQAICGAQSPLSAVSDAAAR